MPWFWEGACYLCRQHHVLAGTEDGTEHDELSRKLWLLVKQSPETRIGDGISRQTATTKPQTGDSTVTILYVIG